MRNCAMNEVLRDEYIATTAPRACGRPVEQHAGGRGRGRLPPLRCPTCRFHRRQGLYANHHFDPEGNLIDATPPGRPSAPGVAPDPRADRDYVRSLMTQGLCHEPGKMANWIAAPRKGIGGKGLDFEYVRFA